MIITWHEVWGKYWYDYLGWKGFFGKRVESLVAGLNTSMISVSSMTKRDLQLLGVEEKNIHIVPNGIDLNWIFNIHPSPHESDIIFIGRLIREKNVDALIEAVGNVKGSLPEIKCHIIGDGPEKERLVALAAEHGVHDNVSFLGFMEYDEAIARVKSSKVLVLPSIREGFGMVVLEAFACRVPVITVRSPKNAASELVMEQRGSVVNLDPKEFGRAVVALITDNALREKMAQAAIDAAKRYDWNEITTQLSHLYEEILQEE